MKVLYIRGLEFLFDTEDAERIKLWPLTVSEGGGGKQYAMFSSGPYRLIKVHRFIVGATKDQVVDHVNGNSRDNRKENLRVGTLQDNSRNQKPQLLKSLPQGVSKSPYGYRARIKIDKNKSKFLGTFSTPEAAHQEYLNAKRKYHQ